MWLSVSRCGEVVEATWSSCASMDSDKAIIGKIEKCGKDLSWWNKNIFGNVRRELSKKRKMLIEEEAATINESKNYNLRSIYC
uniref:Uncharacterized protein n=1 Tax=Quercus lobata TaxID=97700 RepID=A0A7N2LTJ2_QUELO